jgi:hypothetical protein
MPIDVVSVFGELVAEMLRQVCSFCGETRHPFNHVHRQMKAIEPVEHNHVERCGRSTFLDESSHVHVFVIFALIGQAMNKVRIAVIGENHRPIGREDSVEFSVADPVRMLVLGL